MDMDEKTRATSVSLQYSRNILSLDTDKYFFDVRQNLIIVQAQNAVH